MICDMRELAQAVTCSIDIEKNLYLKSIKKLRI